MKLVRLSAEAQAQETSDANFILAHGVLVQEFTREGGSPVALGMTTESNFFPGTVYVIYTKLAIEGVKSPFQLQVRPTLEIYKTGVEVKRVEIAKDGEIAVFITSMTRMPFTRLKPMFEIAMVSNAAVVMPENTGFNAKPVLKLDVVNFKGNERQPSNTQQVPAQAPADAKKVEDWLSSADIKPTQVNLSTEGRGQLPSVPTVEESFASSPFAPQT